MMGGFVRGRGGFVRGGEGSRHAIPFILLDLAVFFYEWERSEEILHNNSVNGHHHASHANSICSVESQEHEVNRIFSVFTFYLREKSLARRESEISKRQPALHIFFCDESRQNILGIRIQNSENF
jgi:hypothetical protein